MEEDSLGDWRHRGVATLAKDIPAAFPGGPSHKAGTPVYLSALAKNDRGELLGFTAPSPAALALNISIQAAKKADILKGEVTFVNQVTPRGPGRGVPPAQAPRLYDFFEQCMITVVFSFNALEAYCNQKIADEVKDLFTWKRKDRTADELQRKLSTEDKLTIVLPSILGTASPRDDSIWADFKLLKRVRDSTIHTKSSDSYTGSDFRKSSLFSEFFSMPSLMGFPTFAIEVTAFFSKGDEEPRWLRNARELAEELRKAKKPR